MDIKEYIASGIIDSYVLGAVSDQERQEVQCLSKIYPEIKDELLRAEQALEDYARSIAKAPPESLKTSIMKEIQSVPQDNHLTLEKEPSTSTDGSQTTEKTEIRKIPMFYKFGAAASVLIIVTMSFLYFNASNKVDRLSGELTAAEQELTESETLKKRLNELQLAMSNYQERESFINAPTTQKLVLAGTDLKPEANATIYFDKVSQTVMLGSSGMPEIEENKQFQLWAIVDNNPVDLGVLTKGSEFSSKIQLSYTNVQAFAITLEPEGGSETPTLEQLYVIGNV